MNAVPIGIRAILVTFVLYVFASGLFAGWKSFVSKIDGHWWTFRWSTSEEAKVAGRTHEIRISGPHSNMLQCSAALKNTPNATGCIAEEGLLDFFADVIAEGPTLILVLSVLGFLKMLPWIRRGGRQESDTFEAGRL